MLKNEINTEKLHFLSKQVKQSSKVFVCPISFYSSSTFWRHHHRRRRLCRRCHLRRRRYGRRRHCRRCRCHRRHRRRQSHLDSSNNLRKLQKLREIVIRKENYSQGRPPLKFAAPPT